MPCQDHPRQVAVSRGVFTVIREEIFDYVIRLFSTASFIAVSGHHGMIPVAEKESLYHAN